ncbi:MAG TPA: hypothetical protein ACHBX0_02500 [Arsenophonus sp.]
MKEPQAEQSAIDIWQILAIIPSLEVTINQLILHPWSLFAGKLHQGHILHINYQSENIQFVARTTAVDYFNIKHLFIWLNEDRLI